MFALFIDRVSSLPASLRGEFVVHYSSSDCGQTDHSDSLFARAQAGDQAAWTTLFHECYPKVRRVVGRRLNSRLRRFVDSTDIANDVLANLAMKVTEFRFGSVAEVRSFLIDAAHKLVIDEDRRRSAKKRDSDRERPISNGDDDDDLMLSSNEPTPSQVAVANETQQQLLADSSLDELERLILERRFEHRDIKDISTETNLSIQKIQRFLRRLSKNYLN